MWLDHVIGLYDWIMRLNINIYYKYCLACNVIEIEIIKLLWNIEKHWTLSVEKWLIIIKIKILFQPSGRKRSLEKRYINVICHRTLVCYRQVVPDGLIKTSNEPQTRLEKLSDSVMKKKALNETFSASEEEFGRFYLLRSLHCFCGCSALCFSFVTFYLRWWAVFYSTLNIMSCKGVNSLIMWHSLSHA